MNLEKLIRRKWAVKLKVDRHSISSFDVSRMTDQKQK